MKRKYGYGIIAAVVLMAATGLAAQQTDIYFLIKKNFNIFSKAYENVALEYVDEVDPEVLMRNGIDAMLETLDPYTVMFDESQNEQAEIRSRGNYAGVGIDAGFRESEIVVISPVEGGPADQAGIHAGDIIVAVDGVSVDGLQPEEVQSLLSGEVGSEVIISIERFGLRQTLDFTLKRSRIEIKNVSFSGLTGEEASVGYIRLNQFGRNSAEEIRQSVIDLEEQNDIKGLILDLRGNPGGILQEAIAIIDKFIEPGIVVVETRGRLAEYNEVYKTQEPVMFKKSLVILMNEGSASASEVVAGTLQDLDRALIMGEQSFGKGLVQVVKPLPYNTSLKLTISRYYIPSGRSIQAVQYTHEGKHSALSSSDTTRKASFKTRNGRTVYEGRGIEPDITMEEKDLNLLEVALLRQGVYFDFATRYEADHESFNAGSLPDEIYQDFQAYLKDKNFQYRTDSEALLGELKAELAGVKSAEKQLNALEQAILNEKENRFKDSENNIRNTLYLELVSRYKGQSGKMEERLKLDPQIQKAINFIQNPEDIRNVLEGQ